MRSFHVKQYSCTISLIMPEIQATSFAGTDAGNGKAAAVDTGSTAVQEHGPLVAETLIRRS